MIPVGIARPGTRRYAQDTGHKIYTGSGRQGGKPYVLFEDQV
jgi:hypothetical protein